jgi:uncharacterized protein YlxW (UPF0749 family)
MSSAPDPGHGARRGGRFVVAFLALLLGFGVAVQLRAAGEDELLARASRGDLVRILDGLTQRADALEQEIAELEATRRELASGADRGQAALDAATERVTTLGILAGTVAASGPGVGLRIDDPDRALPASVLLSAVQELRDAGAEAMQVGGAGGDVVRVVVSTSFLDADGGALVDGTLLRPPYQVTAIGEPSTMATALGIPGGLVEEVSSQGGTATVTESGEVLVDTVVTLTPPEYARPS